MKMMMVLMIIFGAAVGTATFIENAWDTPAAKILVFNAAWFEVLLFMLTLNLLGGMFTYKLFRREKLSQLLFHLAFALILLGAGITRKYGFEGQMIIKEGEKKNIMYSAEPYLQVQLGDAEALNWYPVPGPMWMSEGTNNDFEFKLEVPNKPYVMVRYADYRTDVTEQVRPGKGKGKHVLRFNVAGKDFYLQQGETKVLGNKIVGFDSEAPADIEFTAKSNGRIYMRSGIDLVGNLPKIGGEVGQGGMARVDTFYQFNDYELKYGYVMMNQAEGVFFRTMSHYDDAVLGYYKAKREKTGQDILFVDVEYDKTTERMALIGGASQTPVFYQLAFDDLVIRMAYGPKRIELPFSVECRDFRLEKYPGSDAPSSFESDLTIHDPQEGHTQEASLYMNHVLDYRGYRFFQSSYQWSDPRKMNSEPPDTTVLSVNHDLPGTVVTYLGYILMALGFIWTLFNPNSRFGMLRRKAKELRNKRLAGVVVALTLSQLSFAQYTSPDDNKSLDPEVIESCERILVQSFQGRMSTLQTHAIDILYKVKKKRNHKVGERTLSATEAYLSMITTPGAWYKEELIRVKHDRIREILGMKEDQEYASVYDFYDKHKLEKDSNDYDLNSTFFLEYGDAHRVPDRNKTELHKELIKTYERYQIMRWVLSGVMFRVMPVSDLKNDEWVSLQQLSHGEYRGVDLNDAETVLRGFMFGLLEAFEKGDSKLAVKGAEALINYQRNRGGELMPSESKVSMEILYNNLHGFFYLMMLYTTFGLFLIIFLITEILSMGKRRGWLNLTIKILFWCLVASMIFHAFTLGLRWYVTGHAPWTNGYEALTFIAFATMIAGLVFYRSSRFALGATGILAGLILGIAHAANLDPELTNLVPVLKSIWLVIHVAIITASYGFLGLGAILGLINLVLFVVRNQKNKKAVNTAISELTVTSEQTMTIGLYMAAIGTFLGGVWANESWGRYWGWDPKETWALVIVITYAVVLHMRFIPFLKSKLTFNIASVIAFASVIMTYFGVNYYLANGLHSYAQGEQTGLPMWANISILVILALCGVALWRDQRYRSLMKR